MTAIYIFKKILGGLLMPVPTLALLLVFTGAFWWKIMPKGLRFYCRWVRLDIGPVAVFPGEPLCGS